MGIAVWRGYTKKAAPAPAVVEEKDVNFYDDYDGTIVASYSAADFANLSALPANPSHEGLVAEGWNWTLANAKTYVATYGKLNISQMYHTASGKTEYDVEINEATGMTATINNAEEKDWGDGTTDTNTTHTYTAAGNYTIKMGGATLPSIQNSKKVRAVRIASSVTSIDSSAFFACYTLQYVTISSSVTNIGVAAFYRCYSLRGMTIPSGVTSLLDSIFSTCYSLKYITIPNSITYMETNVFYSCYTLKNITFPNGVPNIGAAVLRNCYSLQSVTIPSSVTSIGNNAFANSIWLTILIVFAVTPPTLGTGVFPTSVQKIYIPNGTLAAYQADASWSALGVPFVELPA